MKFQNELDPVISRNLTNLLKRARAERREYIVRLLSTAWGVTMQDCRTAVAFVLRKLREYEAPRFHRTYHDG